MKTILFTILVICLLQRSFAQEEELPGNEFLEGGWTYADLADCQNNTDCQKALEFGAQFVAYQGATAGVLADNPWELLELTNLYEQEVVSGTNYNFFAYLKDNSTGDVIYANFEIYSEPLTNTLEVISVDYWVLDDPNKPGIYDYEVSYEGEELSIFELDISEWVPWVNEEVWIVVDVSESTDDKNIESLINDGVQFTTQLAQTDGFLPEGDWQIEATNSIQKQEKPEGVHWKFNVNVVNNQTWAELGFVMFEATDGMRDLGLWAVNKVWDTDSK